MSAHRLERTRGLLDRIRQFTDVNPDFSPILLFALTDQLVILFSAEVEEKIGHIVQSYFDSFGSGDLSQFARNKVRVAKFKTSELGEFLKLFDVKDENPRKSVFIHLFGEQAESSYNNLILRRNDIAHLNPNSLGNLTFTELLTLRVSSTESCSLPELGERMLAAFEEALSGIKPSNSN